MSSLHLQREHPEEEEEKREETEQEEAETALISGSLHSRVFGL